MSKNAQRLSQVISTFGPGAMIDLPTRSVVVGGLDLWEMRGDAFTTIPEPRLTMRLEKLLKDQGRLEQSKSLSLRTPPVSDSRPGQLPSYIVAPVFPAYFLCEQVETNVIDGKTARRRRLVRWQDLDARGGRRKFIFDDGKKSDVTPIRFVCACEKGHLQDIDWKWVVHRNQACHEPMWVEEKGTSADPADMTIVCGCKQQLSLQTLFQPGLLGNCRGERPWLLDRDPNGCDQKLKLLTRTATNTYFPQVYTVISLPTAEDELMRLVDGLSGELGNVHSLQDMAAAKRFNSKVAAALGTYADEDIFARLLAFARERQRMPAGRRSCPSLTSSRAAGPRLDKTTRRRSSTRKRCRARLGRMRPPALISPQSKISLLYIGCAKCRACTASRGSRRHRRLRTENSRTCSLRCAVRRFPVTPIGCRRSSSSGKASSSISTRPPSGGGSRAARPRRATIGW